MSVTLELHVADRSNAIRRCVDFCQTLSVERDLLDLFVQPLLLDMIFLGTHQLRGGVYVLFFFKVSFEKHSNAHTAYKRAAFVPAAYTIIVSNVKFY